MSVLYKVIITVRMLEETSPPSTVQAITKEKLQPIQTGAETGEFYASAKTRQEALSLALERAQDFAGRLCSRQAEEPEGQAS